MDNVLVVADDLKAAKAHHHRTHWLALEPGGKRIVMTGGGTLAGGVYLIDMDPKTGKPARGRSSSHRARDSRDPI